MTTTFYLKHRPQSFRELDSTEVREELQKIFRSGKPSHAFLFSGPRGIGKTSAARIIAKAVNCLEPVEGEPCNKCKNCLSITRGTNVDVFEIDAASNRGIDDIKELREKIKLAPAGLKYKVYIIDEVHMLTNEAFNALLKTLEEPPGHALFVLCTTDPEKLPKTIISRCHRLNFKRATDKEIVERLKKICSQEKLKCDQEALEEIARLADGDFRDAVKILGQVSLGGSVSVEEVKKVAGILGEFSVEDFLALLAKKKAKESLVWINQAVEQGVNLRVLLESLLETLRQMMLSGFGLGEGTPKIELNGEEIKTLIELFSRAYFELKSAVIPQLPIEMAIVEWAEDKEDKKEDSDEGSKSEIKEQEVKALEAVESPLKLEEVITKWPAILEEVKPLNHSVQAFLKASRPLACQGEFLILEVFYKFHKDQLETEKCRRIFEKGASKVLGLPIKLKCSLSESQRSAKPLPVIEQLAPAPNMETKAGASQVAEGAEDDIIKFAEEIFNKGGTIQ